MKKCFSKFVSAIAVSAVAVIGFVSCDLGNSFSEISESGYEESEIVSRAADYTLKSTSRYYKPREFYFDMNNPSSQWSWSRCMESEHFYVFWEKGFGSNPNSSSLPANMRVDVNDLLAKAEGFYSTNINKLKMVTVGQGRSQLDRYKMQIYLKYQTEWLATGSGYDNVIGALWVNPSTCQPVSNTIAHEIGHSFQYQVYCDQILNGTANNYSTGFRYGIGGGNDGNSYWEQCAQWQAFQDYPAEALRTGWHRVWLDNYFRHFHHEKMRYGSYFFQYYLTDKHGMDAYGRIWKESRKPEDSFAAYKRIFCSGNNDVLNARLYEYASRAATYDLAGLRPYVNEWNLTEYRTELLDAGNGYSRVSYANCVQPTGFNVIPVSYSRAQEKITVNLRGLYQGTALLSSDPGRIFDADGKQTGTTRNYNRRINDSEALWNFGFVAYNRDGSRTYTPYATASAGTEARASYVTTGNEKYIYLVVAGATRNYIQNPWDNNDATDVQLPYEIRFEKRGCTNVSFGKKAFDFNTVSFSSAYPSAQVSVTADGVMLGKLCDAFAMSPDEIKASFKGILAGTDGRPENGKISLGLRQADGSISYWYTATKGFYFTREGNLGNWRKGAGSFIEFDSGSLTFTIGCDASSVRAGEKYTARPVFVYMENGKTYTADFVFEYNYR